MHAVVLHAAKALHLLPSSQVALGQIFPKAVYRAGCAEIKLWSSVALSVTGLGSTLPDLFSFV